MALLLKGGLGAKLAVLALGIAVGVGGITAGAKLHQFFGMRNVAIGVVLQTQSSGFTARLRNGRIVTVTVTSGTQIIGFRDARLSSAQIQPGMRVLVIYMKGASSASDIQAVKIRIIGKGFTRNSFQHGPKHKPAP